MKKFLTAGAALVGFGLSNLALAYDGTITFNGEVSSKTCTITSKQLNQEIPLPSVSQSSLAPGENSGLNRFTIEVGSCTPGTKVMAQFEIADNVDPVTGVLMNRLQGADASNAMVQIFNKNGMPINLADGTNNLQEVTGSNNDAELVFFAAYLAPAAEAIKPGAVMTQVAYSMSYE